MYQLRAVTISDAASLVELFTQLPRETQFMMLEPGERVPTLAQQQTRIQQLSDADDRHMEVAVADDDQQVVGFVVVNQGSFQRNGHQFDLIMGLLKAHWRQGLGHRLVSAAEQWIRAQAGRRIELTVRCANTAAIQLYQRCGFRIEGRRIGSLCVDNKYVDEYYMGKWLDDAAPVDQLPEKDAQMAAVGLADQGVTGLNHVTIVVADLNRSLQFYTERLSFTPLVRWQRGAYLQLGSLWLCLMVGVPDQRNDYGHIALSVHPDYFSELAAQLRLTGVPEWQVNQSEGASIYFADPDGHRLEIHSGDMISRLTSLRKSSYDGLEWLS